LEHADTAAGRLELRRRDADDVLLTIGGRVLMNSRAQRSEVALAELACRPLATHPGASVLIGGLGLGFTLRAALDLLPPVARVVVAEIDPTIVRWCRQHLGELNRNAVDDPRVRLCIEDVTHTVRRSPAGSFDAILFDLYEGPSSATRALDDPLYGTSIIDAVRVALRPGGVFAVWAEQPCAAFEARLQRAGFAVERTRPGRGGLRHAVYLARVAGSKGASAGARRGDAVRGARPDLREGARRRGG